MTLRAARRGCAAALLRPRLPCPYALRSLCDTEYSLTKRRWWLALQQLPHRGERSGVRRVRRIEGAEDHPLGAPVDVRAETLRQPRRPADQNLRRQRAAFGLLLRAGLVVAGEHQPAPRERRIG